MNTNYKVNIGGLAFTLSQDAHDKLSIYLSKLEQSFAHQENTKEILEGIEERIAELLMEKTGKDQLIQIEIIDEIIQILGDPESIDENNEQENEHPEMKFSRAEDEKPKRKLFRDPNRKLIGGFLSGLAHYLGVRVVFTRLAYIFLILYTSKGFAHLFHTDDMAVALFLGILIYTIACILIPPARTVEEQWAMTGEAGDINDIKSRPTPRYSRNYRPSYTYGPNDSLLKRLLIAIIKIVGFCLILTASSIIFSLVSVFFFSSLFDYLSLNDLLHFLNFEKTGIIISLLFVVCLLPCIGLMYLGAKLVFGFKEPRWKPSLIAVILFVGSLTVLSFITFPELKAYSHHKAFEQADTTLASLQSDTLYITQVFEGPSKQVYRNLDLEQEDEIEINSIYIDKSRKEILMFPFISINHIDSLKNSCINHETQIFYRPWLGDGEQLMATKPYLLKGRRLYLFGQPINRKTPWNKRIDKIEISLPKNISVIFQDTLAGRFQ